MLYPYSIYLVSSHLLFPKIFRFGIFCKMLHNWTTNFCSFMTKRTKSLFLRWYFNRSKFTFEATRSKRCFTPRSVYAPCSVSTLPDARDRLIKTSYRWLKLHQCYLIKIFDLTTLIILGAFVFYVQTLLTKWKPWTFRFDVPIRKTRYEILV